jgi:hypothetical protein
MLGLLPALALQLSSFLSWAASTRTNDRAALRRTTADRLVVSASSAVWPDPEPNFQSPPQARIALIVAKSAGFLAGRVADELPPWIQRHRSAQLQLLRRFAANGSTIPRRPT